MAKHKSSPFPNIFYVHRSPGKSSPRSFMIYSKVGPHFSTLTAQQRKISEAGKKCGAEIRGKYEGAGQVKARRSAMGACIRREFGR